MKVRMVQLRMPKIFAGSTKGNKYRGLADAARDERRWDDAAILYKNYLQYFPDDAALTIQYGHALKESGKIDEAELAYKRALRIEPNQAEIYLQLGHVYKLTGRRVEAIDAYRAAFERDPHLKDAATELENLGFDFDRLGNTIATDNDETIQSEFNALKEELRDELKRAQTPLIKHMSTMLEQLSTIKAITFQLKRIQSDIEKINERSGDIERRMQKLENAVNRGSEQSISRSRRSSLS